MEGGREDEEAARREGEREGGKEGILKAQKETKPGRDGYLMKALKFFTACSLDDQSSACDH